VILGKKAVVIGAGIAGLAAAGALADWFEHVVVLERDGLPSTPAPRAGTPQSRHLHGLLAGGQRALEALFPGFTTALLEAGAAPLRAGFDVLVEMPGFDPFPQRDFSWKIYSMSRPLVEWVVRKQLIKRANVELRANCRVRRITATETNGAAVSGVQLTDASGGDAVEPADVVVDASGRGVLTSELLQATGYPLPAETKIGIYMAYATRVFSIPESAPPDWKGVAIFPNASESARGALMMPIEGDCWMLSLGGAHGDVPPGDPDGFFSFVAHLRTKTICNAIKDATALDAAVRFAFPESVWRHFERLHSFPCGLLPIGDVICRFNPVYGQGMSVAAQEACVLGDILAARSAEREPLAGLAQAFFVAIQDVIDTPWATAAIADFVYPQTRGERPSDMQNTIKFGTAILRLAARDPEIHKLRAEVLHLLKPRSVYRDPAFLDRIRSEMAKM
jgi:2-polyprenyl-6-methoxyphenol hydroxylase-like FAD-dependent oxidoreductase